MNKNVHVFVFSFNRGSHLINCVNSIRHCAPEWGVTVVDDDSTDKKTIQCLDHLKGEIEVIRSNDSARTDYKTGALYRNMNLAFDIAKQRKVGRVLFIQDDMQFVRKLTEQDLVGIDLYFEKNLNVIQLQSCFRNKTGAGEFNATSELDVSGGARFRLKEHEVGKDNFSAVGIFDLDRVGYCLGEFRESEVSNSLVARQKGIRLGYSIYPFMHWTPYPISHRGRKRGLLHAIIEYLGGAGFHPIDIMSDSDAMRLLSRKCSSLCAIEDFCTAQGIPAGIPWVAGGGEYMMLGRNGLPAKTFRALRSIKRSLFRSGV